MSDRTNSKYTVAVGIPTYNNAETIRKTLESLLSQTRKPNRIIVVDASNDRTPDIVRNVSESSEIQIEYHRQSDRGRGVGAARQDIYELLEEDVLACLDTHQVVDENWLEKRMKFHRNHPEYDALSSTHSNDVERPIENVKDPNFLVQSNCSILKSALDRVDGWDPWMSRGEDWDLKIRLWTSGGETYVKSGLESKSLTKDDAEEAFGKILERPSSIDFIRKYGLWYISFHPIHLLGELASVFSIIAFAAALILAVIWSSLAIGLLSIPLIGSLTYLYMKSFRGQSTLSNLQMNHVIIALRFFILGYTMLRKLLTAQDREWNSSGFVPDSR